MPRGLRSRRCHQQRWCPREPSHLAGQRTLGTFSQAGWVCSCPCCWPCAFPNPSPRIQGRCCPGTPSSRLAPFVGTYQNVHDKWMSQQQCRRCRAKTDAEEPVCAWFQRFCGDSSHLPLSKCLPVSFFITSYSSPSPSTIIRDVAPPQSVPRKTNQSINIKSDIAVGSSQQCEGSERHAAPVSPFLRGNGHTRGIIWRFSVETLQYCDIAVGSSQQCEGGQVHGPELRRKEGGSTTLILN